MRRLLLPLLCLAAWPAHGDTPPVLGEATRVWLAAHGSWRVAVVPGWPPVDQVDAQGVHTGLSADVLRDAAQRLGVQLRVSVFANAQQAMAAAGAGQVEVLASATRSADSAPDLLFTRPYARLEVAFIGRQDMANVQASSGLEGRVVAVEKGTYAEAVIEMRYPLARRLPVDGTLAALRAVEAGRADLYRGALLPAHVLAERAPVARLAVLGRDASDPGELKFASRDPQLVMALDAALAAAGEPALRGMVEWWRPAYVSLMPRGAPPLPIGRAAWEPGAREPAPVLAPAADHAAALPFGAEGVLGSGLALLLALPVVAVMAGLLLTCLLSARRLQAAQATLREQRDSAQRLAQDNADFLADIGHDVRTPLVALASGIRLLRSRLMPGEEADMLAGRLIDSADGLVNLLNQLLDKSRLEAGRLELHRSPGSIARIVQEAAEHFRPAAQAKGLAFTTDVADGVPVLLLDASRTTQVVNNLVGNAIKFTEAGHVHVELRAQALRNGWWKLVLTVSDSGVGMDAATRNKLFDRFSQGTDAPRHGGHGLGMSIVAELVRLAQGRVQVFSDEGKGTRIEVVVIAEGVSPEAPEAARQREPGAATGRSVFLVEDDEATRLVLADRMRRRGLPVFECFDVAEAFEQYLTLQPAIFLTDANLGAGISGPVLAHRVKKAFGPRVVTAVLSGELPPPILPAGVDAWIVKPASVWAEAWLDEVEALQRMPDAGRRGPAAPVRTR